MSKKVRPEFSVHKLRKKKRTPLPSKLSAQAREILNRVKAIREAQREAEG
jgi:hypothetical protein